MDLNTRVRIPPHIMTRRVGEDVVVLDLQSGIYFGLDDVGVRVWGLLEKGETVGAAITAITEAYDVAPETVRPDVCELVQELLDRRLLLERT